MPPVTYSFILITPESVGKTHTTVGNDFNNLQFNCGYPFIRRENAIQTVGKWGLQVITQTDFSSQSAHKHKIKVPSVSNHLGFRAEVSRVPLLLSSET